MTNAKLAKMVIWPLIVFILIASLGLLATRKGKKVGHRSNRAPVTKEEKHRASTANEEDKIRGVILSHLIKPSIVGQDLTQQLFGIPVKFELYETSEKKVYFSVASDEFDRATLSRLSKNPANIQFGHFDENRGGTVLGSLIYYKTGRYLFRFPYSEMIVDPNKHLCFSFGEYRYCISPKEIKGFIDNKCVYGGMLYAKSGYQEVFVNHGAFVAKRAEPSLTRLTRQITVGTYSAEEKAQALLDFVTRKIHYDEDIAEGDSVRDVQTMQKADEVLMKGSADCSGKTILYASLLEQENVPYWLMYAEGHVTVCVEGDFSNLNGLSFNIGKRRCSIAETTATGFEIGKEPLTAEIRPQYFQRPGSRDEIFNAKTGQKVEFD